MSNTDLEILAKSNKQLLNKSRYAEARAEHYLVISQFLMQEFGLKKQVEKRLKKARKKLTGEELQRWEDTMNFVEMLESKRKYQSS